MVNGTGSILKWGEDFREETIIGETLEFRRLDIKETGKTWQVRGSKESQPDIFETDRCWLDPASDNNTR